ncbi:uncharacterized protein ARMOST_15953 [Armillaria ostoyae]|uniref:Uncharacterized protein n=1 Tax=Armillaria ostoyae TaxID=47428 RepID=A0A284RUT3_ARMOS|nr:uncharacterized protein ARMOST_15953 [Armillaria ostoyae]
MTGESRKLTFHTVLRLDAMEHIHHSAGDCFSFLLVDDDTGLEILHVHAMTVLEYGRYHENHHSSVHQSPSVISIPKYSSLLEGASTLVEEESRAALIDMVQVIERLKGRWTGIEHPLSSNHLNTSCPIPLLVVTPFISSVIRRVGAALWRPAQYRHIYQLYQRAWPGPTSKECAQAELETLRQGERPAKEFFIKMPDGTTAVCFYFLLLRVFNNCLVQSSCLSFEVHQGWNDRAIELDARYWHNRIMTAAQRDGSSGMGTPREGSIADREVATDGRMDSAETRRRGLCFSCREHGSLGM